jgi:hypothetical protein
MGRLEAGQTHRLRAGRRFVSAANFGLFERASSYDFHAEIFDTTRDAKNVKLTFPRAARAHRSDSA